MKSCNSLVSDGAHVGHLAPARSHALYEDDQVTGDKGSHIACFWKSPDVLPQEIRDPFMKISVEVFPYFETNSSISFRKFSIN